MRRVLALSLTLAALLAFGGGQRALAHALTLFGHVAVDAQGGVVVRIVDVYGAAVEGQVVRGYATPSDGPPTRAVDFAEDPPGTYRGLVAPPPGGAAYELRVDMELGGDLHRILLPVTAGEAQAEQQVPMIAIDPPQGIDWGRILYIGAAVVLVAATAVALMKKRPVAEGE